MDLLHRMFLWLTAYNGQYVIDDGTLFSVKPGNVKTTVLTNTDLEKVVLDVKNTEYTAVTQQAPSLEGVEQANELEKEMKSQENANRSKTN